MLRLGSLVIALAACSSSAAPAGPAWPRSAAHDSDGGETLSPRPAARVISAIAEEDKPADRAAVERPAAPSPSATPADKPATSPAAAPAEDPAATEDIVIEIDD